MSVKLDNGDELLCALEASRLVNGVVSPQCIREHMKRGIVDLGTVMTSLTGDSGRKRYMISKRKFYKWLGIEGGESKK